MANAQALSAEQEQALFEAYRNHADAVARDQLLAAYDYLPKLLTRRFSGRGMEDDDIYQSARIALMHALSRYDESRGVRFVTYATATIVGEIKRLFRDKGQLIKAPRRVYEIFYKANQIREAALAQSGKAPSASELAALVGVTEKQMAEALEWGDTHFVRSLEQFVSGDDETVFSNLIGAEDDRFLMIENIDFIRDFTDSLSEQERQFVKYRYYDSMTQSAIANLLHISQMQVSRMEKRVLSNLKKMYFEAVNA